MLVQFKLGILLLIGIVSPGLTGGGDPSGNLESGHFHSAQNAANPNLSTQGSSSIGISGWSNVPSSSDWEYFADGTVCAIAKVKRDAAGRGIAFYFSNKSSIPDSITLTYRGDKDRPISKSSTSYVLIDDIVMPANIDGDFGGYAKIKIDDYRFKEAVRRGNEITIVIHGRNRGKFPLKGSSAAFEFIEPCLSGNSLSMKRGLPIDAAISDQRKGSESTITTRLGKPEECSGFYANLKIDGDDTYGLSVNVYGRIQVELQFSDYENYESRAHINEDSSLEFSDRNNSPLWVLRCYEKGGVLYQSSFRDVPSKIYELKKSKGDIFEYALEKGIDLRH